MAESIWHDAYLILYKDNQRLLDELSVAHELIERQNVELESLRPSTDSHALQLPTSGTDEESSASGTLRDGDGKLPRKIRFSANDKLNQISTITMPYDLISGMVPDIFVEKVNDSITVEVGQDATTSVGPNHTPQSLEPRLPRRIPTPYPFTLELLCDGKEQINKASVGSVQQSTPSTRQHEENNVGHPTFEVHKDDWDSPGGGTTIASDFTKKTADEAATRKNKDPPSVGGWTLGDYTNIAINTSASAGGSLKQHHGNNLLTHDSSDVPLSFKSHPDTSDLPVAPLKRIDTPIPDFGLTKRQVERQMLRDALHQDGFYTGWINAETLLPDGFGTMTYKDHQEYTGDWKEGVYHGKGKHTNLNGDIYEGPFEQGVKQGKDAAVTFRDGRYFLGFFRADKMQEGVLHYVDGSSYKGFFENDERNGFGIHCYNNGDQYEGQWKDDRIHGWGLMEWNSDNTWYNGDWEFGVIHGLGTGADGEGNIFHKGYFHYGKPVVNAEHEYGDDEAQ